MSTAAGPATAGYTVGNAMIDIFAAPSRALDEVRGHPRWLWWPLLISMLLAIAAFALYYNWVDFDWLVNETVRGAPADQAEMIRSFMTPNRQIIGSAVGIVVVTLIIYAVQSAYLHLVNKVVGDPSIGYGQWFSFSAWTAFVGVVNSLIMFAVILLADSNQLPLEDLTPLSLNALFIHASPGDAWFTWGSSLTLVNFWMLALMTLGFSRWTRSSMAKSALVAVTPWALLFGIWALLIAT
jgi:hypothetical protein